MLRTVHQGAKAVREVVHDGEMKVTKQDENALKRFHEMPACEHDEEDVYRRDGVTWIPWTAEG